MIIESQDGLQVVAVASDGIEALEAARKHRPAVVILDAGLPVLNGIDVTRRLCAEVFAPKVLCLSSHSDSHHLSGVLGAGACGYLLKEHSADDLVRAIRIVEAGGTYLSPQVADEIVAGYVEHYREAHTASRFSQLTDREREVLQLVSEGVEGQDAAVHLNVSPKTVYSHLEHIMDKLSAHSIADLTRYALREGITTL